MNILENKWINAEKSVRNASYTLNKTILVDKKIIISGIPQVYYFYLYNSEISNYISRHISIKRLSSRPKRFDYKINSLGTIYENN
jgi:hypothetical protein